MIRIGLWVFVVGLVIAVTTLSTAVAGVLIFGAQMFVLWAFEADILQTIRIGNQVGVFMPAFIATVFSASLAFDFLRRVSHE